MALAEQTGALLVDESFADPRPELSVAPRAEQRRGLFVLRSFGKFYGLAGLRLGFVLGHPEDIAALSEMAHVLAGAVLTPGGALVLKVFHGGGEADLMAALKHDFTRVRTAKPDASRPESGETYVVATGFRGAASEPRS